MPFSRASIKSFQIKSEKRERKNEGLFLFLFFQFWLFERCKLIYICFKSKLNKKWRKNGIKSGENDVTDMIRMEIKRRQEEKKTFCKYA